MVCRACDSNAFSWGRGWRAKMMRSGVERATKMVRKPCFCIGRARALQTAYRPALSDSQFWHVFRRAGWNRIRLIRRSGVRRSTTTWRKAMEKKFSESDDSSRASRGRAEGEQFASIPQTPTCLALESRAGLPDSDLRFPLPKRDILFRCPVEAWTAAAALLRHQSASAPQLLSQFFLQRPRSRDLPHNLKPPLLRSTIPPARFLWSSI
jgi:hypothetical protein